MAQTHQTYPSNVDPRVAFLDFFEEYRDVTAAVAEAVGMRKDLRTRMKGSGVNLPAFDRAWKASEKSGDLREKEHQSFVTYMGWLDKPVGVVVTEPTAAAPAAATTPAEGTIAEHQVRRVDDAGFLAGKANYAIEANPWTPGTELHAVWEEGWHRGKAAIDDDATNNDAPRPRGRPRGSRNRAHEEQQPAAA